MYVGELLKQLHQAEGDLAEEHRTVGERHAVEHDVFHTCHTLAEQCLEHANRLRPFVERYGGTVVEVREEPGPWATLMAAVRRTVAETSGRRPEPGLLLLRDLRDLSLSITECDVLWVMAGQAAQVLRDRELLDLVTSCDEQVMTQLRWAKTRIKEASPQILVVG